MTLDPGLWLQDLRDCYVLLKEKTENMDGK